MREPFTRIQIDLKYEEYQLLLQKKGRKTWKEILLEWANNENCVEVKA